MPQRTPLVTALAVACLAGSAPAQLNRAHDDGYKTLLDLSGKLNDCVNNAEARVKFDDVKSLADNYYRGLDKMMGYVENIGRNFKDGLNSDWARSVRSPLLDKIKDARTKAENLKNKASNKQDCNDDVRALAAALSQLSDAYKTCVQSHNERLKRVLEDYSAVQNVWFDLTKDDRRQIEEAEIKYRQAVEKRKEMLEKLLRAQEAFTKILEEDEKIRKAFQEAKDKDPDQAERLRSNHKTSRELVKRVGNLVNEMEKEVKNLASNVLDRHAEMIVAIETYEKEALQSDNTLVKEVLPRQVRMTEMKAEYDGKVSF